VIDPILDPDESYKIRIRDVSVNGTVSEWSEEVAFTSINVFVDEPTVTIEGSPDAVPENPTISTSAFSVTNGSDTHESTDWEVIRTSDSTVVFESLNDTSNLTSITVTADLDRQDQFEFRARHRGTTFGTSSYGSVTATTDAFVDEPTVSVEDGPSDVPENPTISTSAFSVTNGSDTHESTDWEVIRTSDSVTVFESLNDTSNLTSITVTTSLDESTEYEFRARHRGTDFGESSYGSVTATTLDQFFAPTTLGEAGGGGFYMGTIAAAGTTYYLIVAPNATGCACCDWKTSETSTAGTCSDVDGYANTYPAMENSTHPAGNWTATRTIGGFSDWYLPAIDELEVFYNNGGGNGSGDPLPSGEDFATDYYWSSTENNTTGACNLTFSNGSRSLFICKDTTREVRAVRRVPI
jgi:hypothetical protein